jgi:hypothetical protein
MLIRTNTYANLKSIKLNIYPNPSSEKVTVDLPNTEIEKVLLYDSHGRRLKDIIIPSETLNVEISLNGLNSGIYFLRTQVDSNETKGIYSGIFQKN